MPSGNFARVRFLPPTIGLDGIVRKSAPRAENLVKLLSFSSPLVSKPNTLGTAPNLLFIPLI